MSQQDQRREPRQQQRQRPTVRRALIVEAARQAIIRDGLHRTTLRDIAAQAQVSLGTVTYHFKSINEILSAAAVSEAERFYAPLVRAATDEADPARALLLLIDPLFDGAESTSRHWRFWSDYWSASARSKNLSGEDYEALRLWQTGFEQTIERGILAGVFDTDISPSEVAVKTAAFSDGLATQLSMHTRDLDHNIARTWLRQLLGRELGADFEATNTVRES